MNWIRRLQIFLFLLGIIFLVISWELKHFTSLLLVGAIFSALLASINSTFQAIFIPLTAIFSITASAELALPFLSKSPTNMTTYDYTSDCQSGHYDYRIEGFGYGLNPGIYNCRKLTSAGELIYDVIYTIGEDGYRKDIENTDYSVYIFGGSFTFGEGLNDNETLSYYLFHNHEISSKNVGIHGYGLHQALYTIEHDLVQQQQDVVNVVLTAPWHSLRSSCKEPYALGTPKYQITSEGLRLSGVCDAEAPERHFIQKILDQSNLFSLVASVFNDKNKMTDSDLELYFEIIKEISRLTKNNDSELLIAYIDASNERLKTTSWNNESIISELSKFGTVIDVTLAQTREKLDPSFFIHELDMHPSALANEYRAQIIASQLQN